MCSSRRPLKTSGAFRSLPPFPHSSRPRGILQLTGTKVFGFKGQSKMVQVWKMIVGEYFSQSHWGRGATKALRRFPFVQLWSIHLHRQAYRSKEKPAWFQACFILRQRIWATTLPLPHRLILLAFSLNLVVLKSDYNTFTDDRSLLFQEGYSNSEKSLSTQRGNEKRMINSPNSKVRLWRMASGRTQQSWPLALWGWGTPRICVSLGFILAWEKSLLCP